MLYFPLAFDKFLEKVVVKQVKELLYSSGLFDRFHPRLSYRSGTETALVTIMNDLHTTLEKGSLSLFGLLDLPMGFLFCKWLDSIALPR